MTIKYSFRKCLEKLTVHPNLRHLNEQQSKTSNLERTLSARLPKHASPVATAAPLGDWEPAEFETSSAPPPRAPPPWALPLLNLSLQVETRAAHCTLMMSLVNNTQCASIRHQIADASDAVVALGMRFPCRFSLVRTLRTLLFPVLRPVFAVLTGGRVEASDFVTRLIAGGKLESHLDQFTWELTFHQVLPSYF